MKGQGIGVILLILLALWAWSKREVKAAEPKAEIIPYGPPAPLPFVPMPDIGEVGVLYPQPEPVVAVPVPLECPRCGSSNLITEMVMGMTLAGQTPVSSKTYICGDCGYRWQGEEHGLGYISLPRTEITIPTIPTLMPTVIINGVPYPESAPEVWAPLGYKSYEEYKAAPSAPNYGFILGEGGIFGGAILQ